VTAVTTMTEELVTGIVEHIGMYEKEIGFRDRCVVFLLIDGQSRMFVFDADVRDHLPIGRRVQIRYRPSQNEDTLTLLDRKVL
jgi:hypothetical protein